MRKISSIAFVALFLLAGCKASFHASGGVTMGEEISGNGITFLVPSETSSSSSGSNALEYKGDSVSAKSDGKTLTVNGKDYGAVKSGDKVNLREPGKVLVNDSVREPVAAP